MQRRCSRLIALALALPFAAGGCVNYNLDPRIAAVSDGEMPAVAGPIPVRLRVDYDYDGRRHDSPKSQTYKIARRALEETGVFAVREGAAAEVTLAGFIDVDDGYAGRAFVTGLTYGLAGQDEGVRQAVTLTYAPAAGDGHERAYEYEHAIGTGSRAGSVKKLDGDDVSESAAERETIRRVVRRFVADLAAAGALG